MRDGKISYLSYHLSIPEVYPEWTPLREDSDNNSGDLCCRRPPTQPPLACGEEPTFVRQSVKSDASTSLIPNRQRQRVRKHEQLSERLSSLLLTL